MNRRTVNKGLLYLLFSSYATKVTAKAVAAAPNQFTGHYASGQAVLTWDPPTAGTTQTLQRGGVTLPLGAGATSYTDTSLTNGAEYVYTLTHQRGAAASSPATVKVIPLAEHVELSDKPFWADPAQTQRLVVKVTNTTAGALHDQRVTVALPLHAKPTNTDLRVLEYGARGSVDQASDWRYGGIDYNRFFGGLPCTADRGSVTFKAPGKWRSGETRQFALYWGKPHATAKNYAHLSTLAAANSAMYPIGRVGPDTEHLAPTGLGLPLAGVGIGGGRAAFGDRSGGGAVVRTLLFHVQGSGASYGMTAGSVPTITNRNHELLAAGRLTGEPRTGQKAPDWQATYRANYTHRARISARSDRSAPDSILKGFDILKVSLLYTCTNSYAPLDQASMEVLQLYTAVNTHNGAIGPWTLPDGKAILAGAPDSAVPMKEFNQGMVGTSGGALASALKVTRCDFKGWGRAAPTALRWQNFTRNGAALTAEGLKSTQNIPVGAQIALDFTFILSTTNLPPASLGNTTPAEIAEIMKTLEVKL